MSKTSLHPFQQMALEQLADAGTQPNTILEKKAGKTNEPQQASHTPGPLFVQERRGRLEIRESVSPDQDLIATLEGVQPGIAADIWANACLLSAAYNAFDSAAKKLGVNAVELAESMADGGIAELVETVQLFEESRTAFEHANDAASDMIYAEAVERSRGILAKVKGGAE